MAETPTPKPSSEGMHPLDGAEYRLRRAACNYSRNEPDFETALNALKAAARRYGDEWRKWVRTSPKRGG